MISWSPSRTAQSTAFLRASHLRVDDDPPVLADNQAEALLPRIQQRALRRLSRIARPWTRSLRTPNDPFVAMRSQIVTRARYAEDALAVARQDGATRYVVLGAGLDSFALRQSAPFIDVLEIDHPATQRWKRDRMSRAGLEPVHETVFLPIDFEKAMLSEVWPEQAGPDLISWLGVTYYLRREALVATLSDLARITAPGTRLVLDFWDRPSPFDPSRPLLEGTRLSVGLLSEPMRSFLSAREVRAVAAETGWKVRDILSPRDQNRIYLSQRNDGLDVPNFAWLAQLEH